MKADLSMHCEDSRYALMTAYAAVALLVFSVGVPVALFCLLRKHRDGLNPPGFEGAHAWAGHDLAPPIPSNLPPPHPKMRAAPSPLA